MFVSLCLTLPVIQRNLRMVEINKYYYYYYYYICLFDFRSGKKSGKTRERGEFLFLNDA